MLFQCSRNMYTCCSFPTLWSPAKLRTQTLHIWDQISWLHIWRVRVICIAGDSHSHGSHTVTDSHRYESHRYEIHDSHRLSLGGLKSSCIDEVTAECLIARHA